MSYIDDAAVAIAGFEAGVGWMYLDTRGNVTVGIGFLLSSPAVACRLPFAVSSRAASDDEITADFSRVAAMEAGRLASFYRLDTSPLLSQLDMMAELRRRLQVEDTRLAGLYGSWPTLPDLSKMALLDMGYNLGVAGLRDKFPRLNAAVLAGNWAGAAAECERGGIGTARNTWTKNMFLQAAAQA